MVKQIKRPRRIPPATTIDVTWREARWTMVWYLAVGVVFLPMIATPGWFGRVVDVLWWIIWWVDALVLWRRFRRAVVPGVCTVCGTQDHSHGWMVARINGTVKEYCHDHFSDAKSADFLP